MSKVRMEKITRVNLRFTYKNPQAHMEILILYEEKLHDKRRF
jgi:tmRNA-binding protein